MRRAYLFQLSAILLLGCQPAFADSSAGLQASSQATSQGSSQATSQDTSQATSQQSSQATSQSDSQSSTQASTQAQPASPSNLTGDPYWGYGWRYNGDNTWSNGPSNGSGNGGGGNGRQNYVGNNSGFHNQPNQRRFRSQETYGHFPERPGFKRFDNLGLGMPNTYVDARGDSIINAVGGVTALAPNILMPAPRGSAHKRLFTPRYSNPQEYKRSHPQGAASRLAEHRNGARI